MLLADYFETEPKPRRHLDRGEIEAKARQSVAVAKFELPPFGDEADDEPTAANASVGLVAPGQSRGR